MKKLTKISLVVFAISAMASSAFAGALSITGNAKASYTISGGQQNAAKGIGIGNEFTLGASGELDNGYTWTYAMDLDPGAAGAVANDDAKLVVGTPYGTVGIFVSEGGLQKDYGWGTGALGVGSDFASPMSMVYGANISDYNNIQYHLPTGLLPFGITAKAGYAPGAAKDQGNDFKSPGNAAGEDALGTSATHYQITMAPIDGLSIGADYIEVDDTTAAGVVSNDKIDNGSVYVKYTTGPVSVGVGETRTSTPSTKSSTATIQGYENKSFDISYAVNDNLSLSFQQEASVRNETTLLQGTRADADTGKKSTQQTLMAAYTVGGATLGFTMIDVEDSDYTKGKKETLSLFTVEMAF
jgi:hypothetical protein